MCEREGTNPITIDILEQSDMIFVMENSHKKEVKNFINGKFKKELIVLNIPDLYKYYQKELIEILEDRILSYLK